MDCRFCESRIAATASFCSCCGGEAADENEADRTSRRISLAVSLVRSRSWNYVLKVVQAIAAARAPQRKRKKPPSPELGWLAQEMSDALIPHPDHPLPALLDLSQAVLALDDGAALAPLRGKVERLGAFSESLIGVERTSRERGAPVSRKVQAWFAQLARKVRLPMHVAREFVFAGVQHWQTVARTLDPAAFQRVKVHLATANAHQQLREKNFGLAKRQFEAILARRPRHVAAWEGLALTFIRLNQIAEGLRCYRQAVNLGSHRPMAFNNLAWYLLTARTPSPEEIEEAVLLARRAVELAPLPGFWDTLAEAYHRRGDTGAALAAAREALRGEPDKPTYRERLERLLPRPVVPPPLPAEEVYEPEVVEAEVAEEALPLMPALPAADSADMTETLDGGLNTALAPLQEPGLLELSPEDSLPDFEDFSIGVDETDGGRPGGDDIILEFDAE